MDDEVEKMCAEGGQYEPGEATGVEELTVALTETTQVPRSEVVRYMSAAWAGMEGRVRREIAEQMAVHAETIAEMERVETSLREADTLQNVAAEYLAVLVRSEVTRRMGRLGKPVLEREERKRLLRANEHARRRHALRRVWGAGCDERGEARSEKEKSMTAVVLHTRIYQAVCTPALDDAARRCWHAQHAV